MMNLIGKKVIADCGCMNPEMNGKIVGEEFGMFGDYYIIEWENGHREPVTKHTVKHVGERNGVGVYYV